MKVTSKFLANSKTMWEMVEKNPSNYPSSLFLFSNKQLVKDAFSHLDNVDKKNTAKTLQGILNSMNKEVFDSPQLASTLAFAEDIFSKMRHIASKSGGV